MKKIALPAAMVLILFYNSCVNKTHDIQIPEIHGNLKIVENNLGEAPGSNTKLIYEFAVTGKDEFIKVESSMADNKLHSILSYRDGKAAWSEKSSFTIDLQDKEYKNEMNRVVVKQAELIKKANTFPGIARIGNILEEFPELLFKELGETHYFDETTLATFYHIAAFNTAKRSFETKAEECQCGEYQSYVKNESPFFCSEDRIVSADEAHDLIKKISQEKKFAGKQFEPKALLNYLESVSGKFISVSKIDKLFNDEVNYFWNNELTDDERTKILNEYYGAPVTYKMKPANRKGDRDVRPYDLSCLVFGVRTGADCGCCGNYSGPCWYCSIICRLHDKACESCKPRWFCFRGCVPGPCKN